MQYKKLKIMSLIVPLIVLFLNTSPDLKASGTNELDTTGYSIFLVKQQWHTGIVFQVDKVDTLIWREITQFNNSKWVDVGWGDIEFYPHPDPGVGHAVAALFYPTKSTLRVEGFNFSIQRYVNISDIAVQIKLNKEQFDKLCSYVSAAYHYNENNQLNIIEKKYGGNIIFYEAKENYHLFNTCNTWVAEGLKSAGINFNEKIILAEQLFEEANKIGILLKRED